MINIDSWVREQYCALYCDENGRQCAIYLRGPFVAQLKKQRPGDVKAIKSAVELLDQDLLTSHVVPAEYSRAVEWAEREQANHPLRKKGRLQNRAAALSSLASLNIYMHPRVLEVILKGVADRRDVSKARREEGHAEEDSDTSDFQRTVKPPFEDSGVRIAPLSTDTSEGMSNRQLKDWIYQQYLQQASQPGFKQDAFAKRLVQLKPDCKKKIFQFVSICRQPGHKYSFPEPDTVSISKDPVAHLRALPTNQDKTETNALNEPVRHSFEGDLTLGSNVGTPLTRSSSSEILPSRIERSITPPSEIDYSKIHLLQADAMAKEADRQVISSNMDIKHAPLITADIINSADSHLLPQVGFLGTWMNAQDTSKKALFLNTNVPFSIFVCGVQGSGKSHTVSCLLENTLIPSPHLGRLKKPLSALVFHHGKFSPTFRISESAFLAASHPAFPVHSAVRRITVLVPPSNPAIAKLYKKVPRVRAIPFKIKARFLDIDTMLTLMAVDESASPPLYLASVTKIIRQIAMEGAAEFDYLDFKARLGRCNFNAAQCDMLELRLDLLESFLDLDNCCQEPDFLPGEITIMDMSCPFVDANTACVLFSIGLESYLRSKAPGKMIVLDEAHKYMLNIPGARSLNETLTRIIRLQRHHGARVVISTQEPVLLTELIALCSMTVIHRFSSPEWLNALKKHIPVLDQSKQSFLQEIEDLRTGIALIYSSNAILSKEEDGNLLKGNSRLLKVSIRKRVTADGGQSILCIDQ